MSFASQAAGACRRIPRRLQLLLPPLLVFLLFNALVRLGLLLFNGQWSLLLPWRLMPILGIGLLFDLGVATFFLPPLGWLLLAWPARRATGLRRVLSALLLLLCSVMAFVGAAEFTFWNEFASRFNFIAVDYLVYTNEVLGNIRESYNLPLLLGGVVLVALVVWTLLMRQLSHRPQAWDGSGTSGRRRLAAALALALAPLLACVGLDASYKEFSADAQANELAGNGYFDFWHAFRHNEIDYARFYRMLPAGDAASELALELGSPEAAHPFDREVVHEGAEKRLNVVLVSVESLSASFLGSFGNQEGLTPNLDRLAREGLLFTRLYATGTRTVRGLEALSLSVPPTPGHSIVKRPDNAKLFTVGEVFKAKGYEPLYIYGGYGYFDNMNAFFGGNGYTVVDRTALKAADIHFENIWGVADEDLFTLALRELDQRAAAKRPFFAHVMTTSNHRPYTYPAGRIDIPSKTGREGGVKYTDWAIGDFIERAKQKPWFDDTVFVIVADHTHNGRGRQELPPDNYHIPMLIYAPRHVVPGRVDSIASQIDVAPTLLGLLNFSYHSRFFGQDILREGRTHQRALLANYQTVGYYEQGRVVELKPGGRSRVVDAATGRELAEDALGRRLRDEAIAYYQVAADAYRKGELRIAAAPR